jgi:hypothetical protein
MDDRQFDKELTLDPQDWDTLRQLGHQMLDDLVEYLQTVRDRPVWQPILRQSRSSLNNPASQRAELTQVYEVQKQHPPYPMGNIHLASGAGTWAMVP